MLERLIEIVKEIIARHGVKSLIAGMGMYLIYDLAKQEIIVGTYAGVLITILAAVFFLARYFEKKDAPITNGEQK